MYPSLQNPESIRLLTLHPGLPTDPIALSLNEFFIKPGDVTHDFEALSYTWDGQVPSHVTVCNGVQYSVTKNIRDALVALRQPDQLRKLWIDQLCINQSDLEERSQQVSIMSEIYSTAKRVIIWLGDANEHTERVFELLEIFASINKQGYLPSQLSHVAIGGIPQPINSDPSTFEDGRYKVIPDVRDLPILPTVNSQDFAHVQSFLSQSWFTRMWTYQETILGSDLSEIHQGRFAILLSDFLLAITTMGYCAYFEEVIWNDTCKAHFYCTSVKWQRSIHDNNARNFTSQLYITHGLSSQDPRDRVYALRGLCSDQYKSLLVPDYSLQLAQVYGAAVKACINLSGSLEILYHLPHFDDDSDLPSWVPDWRDSRLMCGLAYSMRNPDGRPYYQASKDRDLQLVHCDNPAHLALRGIRLGQVKRALRHRLSPTDEEMIWRECLRWRPKVWRRMYKEEIERMDIPVSCARERGTPDTYSESESLFFSDDPLETTVRRTLTGDMYPLQAIGRLEPNNQMVIFSAYVAWRSCGFQGQVPKQVIIEHDRYVEQAMRSRDLFIVDNEAGDTYLCAAVVGVQPGDWVCVLSGGDAPFVLRQRSIDGSLVNGGTPRTWELMCDCYVHGIMDGEFVEGKNPEDDETFILD